MSGSAGILHGRLAAAPLADLLLQVLRAVCLFVYVSFLCCCVWLSCCLLMCFHVVFPAGLVLLCLVCLLCVYAVVGFYSLWLYIDYVNVLLHVLRVCPSLRARGSLIAYPMLAISCCGLLHSVRGVSHHATVGCCDIIYAG